MPQWFQLWFGKSPPILLVLALALATIPFAVPQEPGAPDPDSPPGDTEGQPFDADAQQAKLDAIYNGSKDEDALAGYLRDHDPIVGGAALQALGERNKHKAREAILEVINDSTEPVRLQVLELLLADPDPDRGLIMRVLRAALKDADPAFPERAIQELLKSDDPEAADALAEAQREGNASVRLLIAKSIGSDDRARPYLSFALGDADETVRNTAEAALSPSTPNEDPKE